MKPSKLYDGTNVNIEFLRMTAGKLQFNWSISTGNVGILLHLEELKLNRTPPFRKLNSGYCDRSLI